MLLHALVVAVSAFIGYQLSRGGDLVDDNYYVIDHYDKEMIMDHLDDTGVVLLKGYGNKIDTPRKFINLMRTFGNVDPIVSGTPPYLKNNIIHSPGFNNGTNHSMFNATFTQYYTKIVKNPGDELAFGEGWHSDLTYLCKPPYISAIRAIELPGNITQTAFRDMRKFYNKLPEVIRDGIQDMQINHTDNVSRWCKHAAVKEINGDKTVYSNGAFARHPIEEKHIGYFQMLMWQLQNGTLYDSFNVTWEKDDILMWDNRIVQHAAIYDYPKDSRREIHRVIVS
jgi:alpha-ketoglutarate-dependent taurine dioxygenase